MKYTTQQRFILLTIIVAFLILGISYALATPPLEASDEYKHYPFVQYVQTTRVLPVLAPDNPGLWLQEAAQPPLYYVLMAILTTGIDTADLPELHHKNPQAFIGNPGQVGNKNLIIHDPQLEAFPWQGSVLAVYLIRLASLALGVGTILVTAHLGLRLFNPRIGLLAAALTAFNPMFLFVSAAVNNDSLAILLGNLGLFLIVLLWQDVPDPRRDWWRYALLGGVLGLGILAKLSLAGLLILVGLALALLSWRARKWQIFIVGGLLIMLPVLLICGWWFLRNWQLYGDPSGLAPFVAVQGSRDIPLDWAGWLDELGTFYRSFWGLFGGVNVAAPQWFYVLMNGLALVATTGIVKWLWTKENRKHFITAGVWLPAIWILIISLLLIRWNIISPAFQGRLIFPALGAVNVLWAVGLLAWFKDKWQIKLALALSSGLFLLAFLLTLITIRPAYAMPQPLAAVPTEAVIDPVLFHAPDGRLQLAGVTMEEDQDVTGAKDPVVITLYWQMLDPVSVDYISSLHLLGRGFESVGQVDRYPAMGMIPTSRWQAGEIYQDVYHIYVNDTAVFPTQLRVAVSLYDDAAEWTLPAANTEGVPIDPLFAGSPVRLGGTAVALPELDFVTNAVFEQGISLVGIRGITGAPGETLPLTIYWQAAGRPDKEYTVFVQLLNPEGERITGADAPPVDNFYPTSIWQAGDVIDDTHFLTLPDDLTPGIYEVIVGLYDPVSGVRLSRVDRSGDHASFSIDVKDE
jgi:4-amino-4-deoxy-L-arabinose transferase-like glycosyltransferase